MSNMVIVKPLTPSGVSSTSGTGATNLLTADPKEVLAYTGTGGVVSIDVDLGAAKTVDSFFLGFFTYSGGSAPTLTIQGGVAGYTETPVVVDQVIAPTSSASPPRRHFFYRVPSSPPSLRFIRFNLTTTNLINYQAGILAIGAAFYPTYNREWGSGRQVVDTGAKELLLGGGFGVGEGARKAGYRWTFGDLSDAETEALYDLALDRGETRPALVVEDPDQTTGLNERLHYGLFDRFDAYERANPQQTRWSMQMVEWV